MREEVGALSSQQQKERESETGEREWKKAGRAVWSAENPQRIRIIFARPTSRSLQEEADAATISQPKRGRRKGGGEGVRGSEKERAYVWELQTTAASTAHGDLIFADIFIQIYFNIFFLLRMRAHNARELCQSKGDRGRKREGKRVEEKEGGGDT